MKDSVLQCPCIYKTHRYFTTAKHFVQRGYHKSVCKPHAARLCHWYCLRYLHAK